MDVKDKMEAKLIHSSPRMMKEGGRGGQPAAAGLFVFFNQIKSQLNSNQQHWRLAI